MLSIREKLPSAKGDFQQGFRTKFAHSMKTADQEWEQYLVHMEMRCKFSVLQPQMALGIYNLKKSFLERFHSAVPMKSPSS